MTERLGAVRFVIFDFDGVFTDNRVIVSEDGKESVVCNRSDGWGIKMMREAGIPMAIVSTEANPVVAARARKLKLECHHGCEDKLKLVSSLCRERGYKLSEVAYLGNDLNDLSCMRAVGLPVAVADAYPEVLEAASLVLKRKGGEGAVREFCDLLLRGQR